MECNNCIHVEVSGSLSENIVSESSINQFKPNKSKVHCCDLDLTFDLAVVTLSLKILSGLYLRNRKV